MKHGLQVLKHGAADLLLDTGWAGLRDRGVGPGGPADGWSFAVTQALAGNHAAENVACLEFALVGPQLEALDTVGCALGGAVARAVLIRVDGTRRVLPPWCGFTLYCGDRLTIGPVTDGLRGYLAVAGGVAAPRVAGSRQSLQPLRLPGVLTAAGGPGLGRFMDPHWAAPHLEQAGEPLRLLPGPQWSDLGWEGEVSPLFRVGDRVDRMGVRLVGEDGMCRLPPGGLLSEPVCPGVVQVPASQEWIILGVGCQTLGGYARCGQVIAADMSRVGQLGPGRGVRFRRVEMPEALEANQRYDLELRRRCQMALVAGRDRAGFYQG